MLIFNESKAQRECTAILRIKKISILLFISVSVVEAPNPLFSFLFAGRSPVQVDSCTIAGVEKIGQQQLLKELAALLRRPGRGAGKRFGALQGAG